MKEAKGRWAMDSVSWLLAAACVGGLSGEALGQPAGGATRSAQAQQWQQEPSVPDACAIKAYRWTEDCVELAIRAGGLQGLERLRYLPLTDSGDAWLTLGGEYRLKAETLDAPSFGLHNTPSYTAIGQRFLLQADLRTHDRLRVFLQFSAATDQGRKPAERSFDKSAVDVAQGFVDLPLPLLPSSTWVRIGRQELDFGGNRLVGVRDGANLRRAFDMVRLESKADNTTVTVFDGHPVRNRAGSFDDDNTPGEAFWGVNTYTTLASKPRTLALNLFFLGRRRDLAVFQEGSGRELRRTFGARASGALDTLDYALQASLQTGRFGSAEIHATGVAGDLGYSLPREVWKPRLGVSFGRASGDRHPGDGKLGTFNVIYPNLGYFTDAPLFYPGNTWDFQPNVRVTPAGGSNLQAGVDVIYRLSKLDAIYEPPGIPLVRGNGQGSTFVAALGYVKWTWQANAHTDVAIAYVHAQAGHVITDKGGRNSSYGLAQLTLKF